MTPIKEDSMRLRQAAFCLESIAHLQHLERELLPLADALREIAERNWPTARSPAGAGADEAAREIPSREGLITQMIHGDSK